MTCVRQPHRYTLNKRNAAVVNDAMIGPGPPSVESHSHDPHSPKPHSFEPRLQERYPAWPRDSSSVDGGNNAQLRCCHPPACAWRNPPHAHSHICVQTRPPQPGTITPRPAGPSRHAGLTNISLSALLGCHASSRTVAAIPPGLRWATQRSATSLAKLAHKQGL